MVGINPIESGGIVVGINPIESGGIVVGINPIESGGIVVGINPIESGNKVVHGSHGEWFPWQQGSRCHFEVVQSLEVDDVFTRYDIHTR